MRSPIHDSFQRFTGENNRYISDHIGIFYDFKKFEELFPWPQNLEIP